MSHPAKLTITTVTCHATDDVTGNDELVGVMGGQQFRIGEFNAGDVRTLNLDLVVPAGATTLQIFEEDVDPNDLLATVDLERDMDGDRIVSILEGSARYVINFKVTSEPD